MKVILLQDIQSAGKQGDVITVADGYGRNYLLPRKLAVPAEGGALKNLETKRLLEERKGEKLLQEAQTQQSALEGKTVVLHARTGAGKLYGRITSQDIADAISRDFGVKMDKRKVTLEAPIKSVGEFDVPLKLHRDITVLIKVSVVGDQA